MNAWQKKQRRAALAALAMFCNRASEAHRQAIKGDPLAMLTLEADRLITMNRISEILHTPQFYDAAARKAGVTINANGMLKIDADEIKEHIKNVGRDI